MTDETPTSNRRKFLKRTSALAAVGLPAVSGAASSKTADKEGEKVTVSFDGDAKANASAPVYLTCTGSTIVDFVPDGATGTVVAACADSSRYLVDFDDGSYSDGHLDEQYIG